MQIGNSVFVKKKPLKHYFFFAVFFLFTFLLSEDIMYHLYYSM